MIKLVNEELDKLAMELIKDEKEHILILNKVDEILVIIDRYNDLINLWRI